MTKPLPPDWKISTVGEACSIRNDLRLPISREERAEMKGQYRYFGPTGELDKIETYRLDGTFALIGEDGDHFLEVEKKPQTQLVSGRFNVNNHAHVIESTDACSAEWFYNYFRHRNLITYLTRQGAGRYKLNKAALQEIPIALPPRNEQRAISTCLREWESAIDKAVRLVATKSAYQRSAMQQLVMSRRFPEKRLCEFATRVKRKNVEGDGLPLTISGQNGLINQSHYFDKRIAAVASEHYTLLKRGEFAYNRSYSTGYPYGAIKRLDAYEEGIVSTLYLGFALNSDAPVLSDYLLYFCEIGGFNHQIHKVAQEGARNHGLLNITAEDFLSIKLPVPPLDEQQRVVAILRANDDELRLRRTTLEKIRLQKNGLMQKLLTGQWRVPLSVGEANEVRA